MPKGNPSRPAWLSVRKWLPLWQMLRTILVLALLVPSSGCIVPSAEVPSQWVAEGRMPFRAVDPLVVAAPDRLYVVGEVLHAYDLQARSWLRLGDLPMVAQHAIWTGDAILARRVGLSSEMYTIPCEDYPGCHYDGLRVRSHEQVIRIAPEPFEATLLLDERSEGEVANGPLVQVDGSIYVVLDEGLRRLDAVTGRMDESGTSSRRPLLAAQADKEVYILGAASMAEASSTPAPWGKQWK